MTYDEWMTEIDNKLFDQFMVVQDDLPDWLSRDAYNSGMTVAEAYSHILDTVSLEDIS